MVDVTITTSVSAATAEVFNDDAASAGRTVTQGPKKRQTETLRFTGAAIVRPIVTSRQPKTLVHMLSFVTIPTQEIQV